MTVIRWDLPVTRRPVGLRVGLEAGPTRSQAPVDSEPVPGWAECQARRVTPDSGRWAVTGGPGVNRRRDPGADEGHAGGARAAWQLLP